MTNLLFLHIGLHKTGSSSIQETLFKSVDALREREIDYFQYTANHSAPIVWLFSSKPDQYHGTLRRGLSLDELAGIRDKVSIFLKAFLCDQRCKSKIISGEDISTLSEEDLVRLRDYVQGAVQCQMRVIIYIRNFYEYLDSLLQELVRFGAVLRDQKEAILAGRGIRPNYKNRIQRFQRVFGPENITIKVFHTRLFRDGDVVADFCDTIGSPELFSALPKVRSNSSLSAEAVHLISRFNELFPFRFGDMSNASSRRKLVRRLSTLEGVKFRITDPNVIAAYDRVIAPDQAFVKTILPDELAAIVLGRKTFAGLDPTPADDGRSPTLLG